MISELQQTLEAASIDPSLAESLEALVPGKYCLHKSWGFGQVAEWQLITGQIIINFEGKHGHPMQVLYAVQSLQPISSTDLRVRIFQDAATVRSQANSSPVELMRGFLQDHGGKATVDQLSSILVPKVFDSASFKKWWDSAKKKLKSDGHFLVPSKKTEPIELHESLLLPHKGLLVQFRVARNMKDQVVATDQILKSLDDFAEEVEVLREVAMQIENAASKGRKLQSPQALELLLARDEICTRHATLEIAPTALTVGQVLQSEELRLPAIFAALPSVKQRRILENFPRAFGEAWKKKTLELAQKVPWRTVADIARLFEGENALPDFQKAIAVSIAERSVSSEILYWICKERGGNVQELFQPGLLIAILITLENDRLGEGGRRSSRLHDLLLDDKKLFQDLLVEADRPTVRDIMRRLLLSPAFDDLNRRSLLARIIKLHPEMQNMVRSDSEVRQEALTVSWASLERRKREYDDLIGRQIPQNVKDIAIARSYGDLRENFEFKSAKEQQAVLARRKAELELMLVKARGTNFESPDTVQVSIGTMVTLEEVTSGDTEVYSILGAWDGAPEHNIVSYQAAIGQALLGKRVGDVVELQDPNGNRKWRIRSIEPFKNLELLSKIHEPLPAFH